MEREAKKGGMERAERRARLPVLGAQAGEGADWAKQSLVGTTGQEQERAQGRHRPSESQASNEAPNPNKGKPGVSWRKAPLGGEETVL